jgi:hypothetical protein
MAKDDSKEDDPKCDCRCNQHKWGHAKKAGGGEFVWFLGFIGALIYYLHLHSGTFWLVILAILKAFVWPIYLVYHLLVFLRV